MYFGKFSIRSQLITITVLPTLIISVVFFLFTSYTLTIFSRDKLQSEATLISSAVGANVSFLVESNNVDEIQKILCLSLTMSVDIQHIELHSLDGKLIAHCGGFPKDSNTARTVKTPIFRQVLSEHGREDLRKNPTGDIIGYVDVVISDRAITQELRNLLIKIALLGLSVAVFGAFLAYLFFRKFASVVSEMVKASEAVSNGQFPTQFKTILSGEIGMMQKAFLSMTNAIDESKRNLEAKIEDRTWELQQKTQKIEEINAQRKALIRRINQSIEEERKKIAFDLHDTLNTVVLVTIGHARNARLLVNNNVHAETKDKLLEEIASIEMNVSYFYNLSRDLVTNLRPEILDEFGLKEALESIVERQSKIDPQCEYTINSPDIFPKLTYDFNIVVYRILQESLSNITKHAQATKCWIDLSAEEEGEDLIVRLAIKDNGKGFDQNLMFGRTGLVGMRERAESINGCLRIDSSQDKGTEILLAARFNQRKQPRFGDSGFLAQNSPRGEFDETL